MSWLSLFLFLIMLAIMFFQVIHGMFSALIMAVICVLSATVALGAHEQLAESMLTNVIGDYAYPASFVGIFGLAVLGLRVLLDMIVARNTLLPGYVDKLGSAVFGIITGLITAGVMGIGIQMIPFGPTILGFQRFDAQDKPHHTLWLDPDAFTLWLCGYLSDNTLSGDPTHWAEIHPDFLTELHWLRNTRSGGSRISVDPESVKVVSDLKKIERLYKFKRSLRRRGTDSFDAVDGPPPGTSWVIVGVKVGNGGADSDGRYRYSRTQVRLVGETENGRTEQYTLKAVGPFGDRYLLTEPAIAGEEEPLWGNDTGLFDFVFEVPTDFTPSFVAFKRAGRAQTPKLPTGGLGGLALTAASALPSIAASTESDDDDEPPRNQRRGSTTPVRPKKKGSYFGDEMPMAIKRYAGTTVESRGSTLSRGQITLLVDEQEEQEGKRGRSQDPERTTLDSFDVPSGLYLLQLNVEALHARSILGGALNIARRVLQQYRVIDKRGRNYWPVGLIAECDSGGEREMEIQFFPEEAEFQRALRSFSRIKYKELTGDYRFVLLFFIPEGVELEKFDAGRKTVDISSLNLVAGG